MCDICDGKTPDESLIDLHLTIARFGWAVMEIEPGRGHPGWAYTIGLQTGFGHPELVVVGLPQGAGPTMLNALGEQVSRGRPFEAGVLGSCRRCGQDVALLDVDERQATGGLMGTWAAYHEALGSELWPRALQLVVACLPETWMWRLDRAEPLLA